MGETHARESEKPAILIVDDVPTNIQVLHNILKGDYQVYFATHGRQALELAEERRPDLILLDVMMPELDGYEVCRRLKEEPRTRDIPVIFITAMDDARDEERGLALGAIDYMTKPVSPAVVRARVRNHLELKRGRDALVERNLALEEATRLREEVDRITRHDLKSPLGGIIGFSEVLQEELAPHLNADQWRMFTALHASAYRMLEMINRSLDLYKMESGHYTLHPAEVDLLTLIERVVNDRRSLRERNGLTTLIEVDGRPPRAGERFTVYGEELLCYTLLGNLIGNALEASPKGGEVRLQLTRNGTRGELRITNQGAIPEEIRDRLFEKYATAGKSDGTGLGTYSARLAARTQGGDVELPVATPERTTLLVWLPLN